MRRDFILLGHDSSFFSDIHILEDEGTTGYKLSSDRVSYPKRTDS